MPATAGTIKVLGQVYPPEWWAGWQHAAQGNCLKLEFQKFFFSGDDCDERMRAIADGRRNLRLHRGRSSVSGQCQRDHRRGLRCVSCVDGIPVPSLLRTCLRILDLGTGSRNRTVYFSFVNLLLYVSFEWIIPFDNKSLPNTNIPYKRSGAHGTDTFNRLFFRCREMLRIGWADLI
jgi:hypothetical protein